MDLRVQARQRLNRTREETKKRETNAERARDATSHPYRWVTEFTETYNEHWKEENRPNPYEPFPRDPYFEFLFDLFRSEPVTWLEKSRDMMVSWACVAHLTCKAMTTPFAGSVLQTQKQDKVEQLVKYAKCLYSRQPDWLKEYFPLAKPLAKQATLELEFANGSYIVGIPGGADQVRSYHPWGYLNDESSFQPEAGECYNEAIAAIKGCIIFNSSAGPGWYADARRDIVRNSEK